MSLFILFSQFTSIYINNVYIVQSTLGVDWQIENLYITPIYDF